jgi:hypothetical protein
MIARACLNSMRHSDAAILQGLAGIAERLENVENAIR